MASDKTIAFAAFSNKYDDEENISVTIGTISEVPHDTHPRPITAAIAANPLPVAVFLSNC